MVQINYANGIFLKYVDIKIISFREVIASFHIVSEKKMYYVETIYCIFESKFI